MRKIIFTRPDGGVSIVQPIRNTFPVPETLTDTEIEQRAWAKLPAEALNPQWVDTAAIPTDRSKRRAWRQNGASIVVDNAAELAAKEQDAISALDRTDRLQFEHLFNLENRTRVLESKAPITKAQYRDTLIAQWKALNP